MLRVDKDTVTIYAASKKYQWLVCLSGRWNSLPADIRHITYTSVLSIISKHTFLTCVLILSCFMSHALSFRPILMIRAIYRQY